MKKPNFIYIGPPKTGSKWITKVLKSHPEVFVSGIDMYFFDRDTNYSKGFDWYKAFLIKRQILILLWENYLMIISILQMQLKELLISIKI